MTVARMPLLKPLPPKPEVAELTTEERDAWAWMMQDGFDATLVNLTPRLARLLLDRVGENRKPTPAAIQRYARAMLAKQWKITHQGVALSTRHEVIDGQHRLYAVVESDTTIEILAVRGVPQDSILVLDDGRTRTDADAIRISDYGLRDLEPIEATSAKRMIRGTRRFMRPVSREDLRAFIIRHRDPIRTVCHLLWQNGRVPNVTHSEVVAVLARASYHMTRDDLVAVITFLSTGNLDSDRFETLLTLREWLIKATRRDLQPRYGKTARAIRAFIDKERLVGKRLVESREELFLLPEERELEEDK